MYEPNCGLDKLLISWGHDEYLVRTRLIPLAISSPHSIQN
jgi:hypothetical protein